MHTIRVSSCYVFDLYFLYSLCVLVIVILYLIIINNIHLQELNSLLLCTHLLSVVCVFVYVCMVCIYIKRRAGICVHSIGPSHLYQTAAIVWWFVTLHCGLSNPGSNPYHGSVYLKTVTDRRLFFYFFKLIFEFSM